MPRVLTELERVAVQLGEAVTDDVAAWGLEHEREGVVLLFVTTRDGLTVEFAGRVVPGVGRDVG
jgi:hypothetical protein